MGFFEGFIIGRESFKGKDGGHGGIISGILYIILVYYIYKWFERVSVEVFSPYLTLLVVTYILMSILIYRYNYGEKGRSLSIDIISIVLTFANLFLCCILGFVLFNKLGNTPFSYFIDQWNVLGWSNYNNFIGAIGEIIWILLMILDIVSKVIGMNIIQRMAIKSFKSLTKN